MVRKEFKVGVDVFASVDELTQKDKDLCLEAVAAYRNSHSPYSEFKVGAAVRLQSGRIVYGSNQENVAFPSGLCAERVALFHIGSVYPDDLIETIAITAHTKNFQILSPVTPCGSCLQVLAEYEKRQQRPITVLLYCEGGEVWKASGIESFLPLLFFEDRLK